MRACNSDRRQSGVTGGRCSGGVTKFARSPAGIADAIRSEHLELDTVRICRDSGAVLKEFSFADCAGGVPELIGVSRERLQQLLYQAADPERVALDATVASVDVRGSDGGAPVVTLESGREIACRVAVGADGVRSAVARSVGAPSTSFVGQAGYRGIAEFDGTPPVAARTVCQVRSAPAAHPWSCAPFSPSASAHGRSGCCRATGVRHESRPARNFRGAAAAQIFGVGVRAGMYPMAGNTVYWFVCFDDDGTPVSSTADEKKASALAMVRGWHHGIVECIQNTRAERISRNRFFDRISPGTLATRIGAAHVTLAGDSLHPMTPNLGQVRSDMLRSRFAAYGGSMCYRWDEAPLRAASSAPRTDDWDRCGLPCRVAAWRWRTASCLHRSWRVCGRTRAQMWALRWALTRRPGPSGACPSPRAGARWARCCSRRCRRSCLRATRRCQNSWTQAISLTTRCLMSGPCDVQRGGKTVRFLRRRRRPAWICMTREASGARGSAVNAAALPERGAQTLGIRTESVSDRIALLRPNTALCDLRSAPAFRAPAGSRSVLQVDCSYACSSPHSTHHRRLQTSHAVLSALEKLSCIKTSTRSQREGLRSCNLAISRRKQQANPRVAVHKRVARQGRHACAAGPDS